MRRSGSGSWRFGHGDMGYLPAALFVRDAARLPVAPAADISPRFAGEVPDCVGRATVYRVLHRAKQKTAQAQEGT